MSHNIRLSGVKFTDLVTLGNIVSEVSKGAATLDANAKTFRTYRGQPNKCDAAIKMPGMYDIGLTRTSDGDYTPMMESAMLYNDLLGDGNGNPLGRVQQEMALREAEYQAAQRGYSTERMPGDKGKVTLRIQVPA